MARPRLRVDDDAEALVTAYCRFEMERRRLCELSVTNAAYNVRHFLAWRANASGAPIALLNAEELHEYVLAEARRLSIGAMRAKVAVLRTFTRFLFVTGLTESDLTGAVQSASGVRFDGLPKAVAPTIVEALLAGCRRERGNGLRDYAILLLMARLGLRAVEVSRLQLGDIHWRSGEITVHGKGGRLDRMPLPADVGEALAGYIKNGRRATEARAVFIQAIHEPLAMSRNAVVLVSRSASARAGIAVVGAHRLRHTTGTELLRHGASLQEVGEVLRQSSAMTTSIYAKVDQSSLALAVQPWPGR